MIIADTSGLYAAYNNKQPEHRDVAAAVDHAEHPLVVSPYVLTELDYLMRTRMSVAAEAAMLEDVAAGAFEVAELRDGELAQVVALIEQYANRNLGLADAANVVLAARYRTTRILTLDERDYRVVRPLWGEAFQILPVDRAA